MNIKINEKMILTTEHSASSYGVPVLICEGGTYGQADSLPDGRPVLEAISEAISGENSLTESEINSILMWCQAFYKPMGRTATYGKKKIRVSFSISKEAHNALIADANATGISKNETLEKILREKYNIT